jgi:hypothetical protein
MYGISGRRVTTSPVTPEIQATVDKRVLWGGVERIKAGGRAEAFFSQAASYLFGGGRGHVGERWSSPRP